MAENLAGQGTYEITDSGNSTMKVVVRLRPENEAELKSVRQTIAKVVDDHVLVFDPMPEITPSFNSMGMSNGPGRKPPALGRRHKDLRFAFDKVFDETTSQVEVFEHTTKLIVDGVLEGINCSVFAYGATGAGKTYTMLGTPENPGVMFLTMNELYKRINEIQQDKTCDVAVSYCEVYNESIRDLIEPSGDLQLREDSQKGLVVSGLSCHMPKSSKEVLSMLESGNKMRTQHPTDANATSSRSHAVFQVFVNQKPQATGLQTQVMQAKMSLIDLAGSERATATLNGGDRFREGANINKSLLALGNCINALADSKEKSVHVPYRNSKLTRLLKDSLGGNCRTVMIANISPSGLHLEDTYNTLKYADRAKQIKTKLVRNVLTVDFHIARYRTIVVVLEKENAELKKKLSEKAAKDPFDAVEALRLQGLVKSVYGERGRLRKQMAELDSSERETLLKICRKERDIARIETISGDESKKGKIMSRVESLHDHVTGIQRQKQTVNEYLYSNNESVGRIQAEINRECDKPSASPALRQLMDTTTEARRLETENAHLWKQTKHLLKYIKNQEKDINNSEKILIQSLTLLRRQHTMLRASNSLTSTLQEMFDDFVRMAQGEKGVAWADQNVAPRSVDNSLMDVSTSSFSRTQLAIFDNFVSHASPIRKTTEIQASSFNVGDFSATFGILSGTVPHNNHVAHCDITSPAVPSDSTRYQSGKLTPRLNGVSFHSSPSTKPGTPLFVTTPRSAFTPKNYLQFHPLSENHSHPNSISFSSRFHTYPTEAAGTPSTLPRVNGVRSPRTTSIKSTFPLLKPSISLTSSKGLPFKKETEGHTTIRQGILTYTPLRALDKPRAPTPIDDGSWSSTSSTYSSKLNSMLNMTGLYEPERRNAVKKAKSPSQSDTSSYTSSSGEYGQSRRPEPYLLPRPILSDKSSKNVSSVTSGHQTYSSLGSAPSPSVPLNMFEDNFVSPVNSECGKKPVGTQGHNPLQAVTAASQYRGHALSSLSPSPTSSTLSSQPKLSQDSQQPVSSPSSFTSINSQPHTTMNASCSSSFRPFDLLSSKSPASSQVPPTSIPTASHYHTLQRASPTTSAGSSNSPVQNQSAPKPVCSSPTKHSSGPKIDSISTLWNRLSPSRRFKSSESLIPPEREEDPIVTPPTALVQPKRITPNSLSGKFAKARKLFGIRKQPNGDNYHAHSVSMSDISQTNSQSVPTTDVQDSNMDNSQAGSLSDGDGDSTFNTTYTVESNKKVSRKVKHAFPLSNGHAQAVASKHVSTKETSNTAVNGTFKKRGIFGNRSNFFSNPHTNEPMSPIDERLKAVESAKQRVSNEAINSRLSQEPSKHTVPSAGDRRPSQEPSKHTVPSAGDRRPSQEPSKHTVPSAGDRRPSQEPSKHTVPSAGNRRPSQEPSKHTVPSAGDRRPSQELSKHTVPSAGDRRPSQEPSKHTVPSAGDRRPSQEPSKHTVPSAGDRRPSQELSKRAIPIAGVHRPSQDPNKTRVSNEPGRKAPSYLQMTKAAASKRIARPQVNKENKGQSNGILLSKARQQGTRPQEMNGFKPREHTATPQLVW